MAGCGSCAPGPVTPAGGGAGARNAGGMNRFSSPSFTMMDAKVSVTGGSTSRGTLAMHGKTVRELGIVNLGACETTERAA